MNRKKLELIFKNFLFKTPYNTVSHLFKMKNEAPNFSEEVYGTNCMEQADKLKKELINANFKKSYLLQSGRHFCVIVEFHKKKLFLDPYLMNEKPIEISEGIFDAYPVIKYKNKKIKSFIKIRIIKNKLIIEKSRFNKEKAEYKTSKFIFNLKNKKHKIEDSTNPKIAFHPEQTSLSLRLLHKNGEVTHLVYPVYKFHGKPVSKKNIFIKTNEGKILGYNSSLFWKQIKILSNQLKVPSQEIIRFISEGAKRYEQFAPKKIDYCSYNPTNN